MRRLAAVGVAVGLLTAACGGGTPSRVAVVRDAPKKTTDARTSRMEVVIERPEPQATTVKVTGEADYTAHRGHMLIDLSQLGLPGPPLDAVFDNAVVYEKFPPALAVMAGSLPPGKTWVKVDLAKEARGEGLDVSRVTQGQGDPSQTLDYLRGVTDDVTQVGTEDIRGTQTTHYRAVVDLNKAAAQSRARDAIKAAVKLLGATQTVDVWVDAEGRARRMKYTADLSKSKVASSTPDIPSSVTFTLDLFDFGVPVDATIPPADQVADISALTGGR